MQIVIEIPKSEIPKYQDIIEIPLHFIDGKVCEAGGYDFDVLPKGHGRLIDADELLKYGACPVGCKGGGEECEEFLHCPIREYDIDSINDTLTIIEADRGEKDEIGD